MSNPHRVGDLELSDNQDFRRGEEKAERVGWTLMLLVILAALLGLFGYGPLSDAPARTPAGGLQVEYNRFARYRAPAELTLQVAPIAVQSGQVQVWVSREYLEGVTVEGITPQPESVQTEGNRLVYTFNAVSGEQPSKITFQLSTRAIGPLSGAAGLIGADEAVDFSTFIYP